VTPSKSHRVVLSLIVLLVFSAVLPACRSTKKDKSVAEQNRQPAFLEEIPADTIFFVGTHEPVPDRVVDSLLSSLESLRKIDEETDDEVTKGLEGALGDGSTAQGDAEDEDEPDLILQEMGGSYSREGLENVGVDPRLRFALYGLGTVPVMRVGLSDPDKFRELFDKLRADSDNPSTRREVAGVVFWEGELEADEDGEDYDFSLGGGSDAPDAESGEPDPPTYELMRITKDEVIFAWVDESTREQALPYFLGIKKPTESLASSGRVGELASRHGLEEWLVMYFDLGTAAEILEDPTAEPTTVTERVLQAEDPWSDYSEACRRDTARMMKPMTIMYGGLREYTDEVTDVVFGLELQEDAARRLAEIRAGTPGYSTRFGQDSLFMAGWGVRTGALVTLAADIAKNFQADPLECEDFEQLNTSSRSIATAKATMPPWASAIDGFSVMLHNVGFDVRQDADGKPKTPLIKPRALAVLDTNKPTALIYFLQTFVPEISNLNLQPDGVPVAIPGAATAYEGLIEPVLFMTRDGIGASVGAEMKEEGIDMLANDEPVTSPIFVMRANVGEAARVTLDELDKVVDAAAENRVERELTEQDIAQSKKLVADLRRLFAQKQLIAGFTVEVDEYGLLMSYRAEGEFWDFAWDEEFSGFDERFESLERVLGTYEEPAPPPDLSDKKVILPGSSTAPGQNTPAPQPGGTGLSGTGEGGGGDAARQAEEEATEQTSDEDDRDAEDAQ
jgi:hypothetical protein